MRFEQYVGIDYSGAQTPSSRLRALQVFAARPHASPRKVQPPGAAKGHWSRQEVAQYCRSVLQSDESVLVGIDHAFSLPLSYMRRYGLRQWDEFLVDFARHWPTAEAHTSIESVRAGNPRAGDARELRLCDRWTATAKSAFQFDVQGSVAKSTHAGLPWLLWLRQSLGPLGHVHFWPFDGFAVPAGRSVLAEVYPSLYRRRFATEGRNADEHDAWSIAAWLRESDRRGVLERYFVPPLTPTERRRAALEGWILGVC